ncbi:sodium:solute symporter family protein [Algoriphagus aestuariicola]|uniref:Sodium:solute symporter family protein n=1 Tax=Algoriphagus aestuariicola TaxID=1852016 RepID=A0ABS3BRD6_9BACT|nr:sodium:solute symporter family protein [Algoriphagus aestuariicola]MBN7800910.1 sodium:solute symporter family protein [Algoriphagus aestuariicola]
MLLTAIICYLAITIAVGAWASKLVKSSKDFVLAGRSLPLFLSASALFATWFGSETIFGASSVFLEEGLIGVIEDPFGGALCLILFGMFYLRPMYRMGVLTIGDVFEQTFGKQVEFFATVFMVPVFFGYVAAQLVALSLIFGTVTGLSLTEGIFLSAGIVVVYTFLGGMWAVSITDFIQTAMIVIGLLAVSVMIAEEAGGVGKILSEAPPETFRFIPEGDFSDWTNYLGAWIILGLGSIPSQDIYQRVMSSKSEKVAVRSTYLAGGFYLTFGLLPLFIALGAKALYPELYLENKQMLLPSMVLAHGGLPVQIIFFGALISAVMSTASSGLLAPAALISENLVKPLFRGKLRDRELLWLLRANVLLVALISTYMATRDSNIYELVAGASILLLVSLFAPLTAGLYWKRASKLGAISSMVVGMLTYLICDSIEFAIDSHVFGLFASIFAMILGSLLFPDPTHSPDELS